MTASRRLTNLAAVAALVWLGMAAAPTAVAKYVGPPQVGFSCVPGETPLSSNQGCYHQIIQCLPGYSACGGKCVNLASDVEHCGACARQCPGGLNGTKICSAGVCQTGFHPPPPHPYISQPVTLISGSGWELKPTRSQTTGDLFAIAGSFSGGSSCSDYYSVLTFDRKKVISTASPDAGFYQSRPWGDSWAASSGYAGLELFSFHNAPFLNTYDQNYALSNDTFELVTLPFLNTTSCSGANPVRGPGIGATKMANLSTPANWDAPVHTWFRPGEAEDGQNVYPDPGGTGLFVVGGPGATDHSRITGNEIGSGLYIKNDVNGKPVNANWYTVPGDNYPGGGTGALWIAPNCFSFPNLNKHPSQVLANEGFASNPNCPFAKFGGDYVSPHDQALLQLPQYQDNNTQPDGSSYNYFDVTSGDPNSPFHGGDLGSHVTVDANPCTHNAIVAYITDKGAVVAKFITPEGNLNGLIHIDDIQPLDVATDLGLSRYVPRVSLATATDLNAGGKCYLFTAYDYTDVVSGDSGDIGFPRVYAKMKVWDITQEGFDEPWTAVRSYGSADDLYSWHSTVTASAFTHNVGWFFYNRQPFSGTTIFRGFVDKDFAASGMTDLGTLSTTTIGVDPGGGDYIQAMPGGDRGGFLVPTWSENGNIVARWVAP
jgi:hypothetical protein